MQLEHLNLSCNPLGMEGLLMILSSESMLFNLKTLDLWSISITDVPSVLTGSLSNFKMIERVNLSFNRFDVANWHTFLPQFLNQISKSLKDLVLNSVGLKVEKESVQPTLLRLIRNLTNLEALDISHNLELLDDPIGFARVLTQIRVSCPNLQTLICQSQSSNPQIICDDSDPKNIEIFNLFTSQVLSFSSLRRLDFSGTFSNLEPAVALKFIGEFC